ncbi:hypothetical protein GDO86_004730 [Hymenochirus boettgeri]|uniref:Piwi-like protein 4 n=1 Tax=Hymenochirus boettgeri TaxID=247094 RepID=A0A8T2K687_9PIPI|nr:hypothetical protein GDO86_004730 [Hymenochirus boettgeri]
MWIMTFQDFSRKNRDLNLALKSPGVGSAMSSPCSSPRDSSSSHGTGRGNGSLNDNGTISAGEGRRVLAERGRRTGANLQDLEVCTRQTMTHVVDKKTGTSGMPVHLMTNLFGLGLQSNWHLYQYRVDFVPELASRRLKTALLFSHEEALGRAKAFDGSMLFLARKIDTVLKLESKTKAGETIQITVTLTNQLPAGSPTCLQFFSILFKKVLKSLSMYQVGRNYYNPADPVVIPQHRLMLWPGFVLSIMHLEAQLVFCADVSHKVLRNETVLDSMHALYSSVPKDRFTDMCGKELLGLVVLTRYNNKTYRVDDIDWSTKPTDTFQKKDGSEITYIEYYRQQYNLEVRDLQQPMLVSLLKFRKNDNLDAPRAVHLLPELCYLTGLSSRALSDFRLMKDLSMETQVDPGRRHQRLQKLAADIQRNPMSRSELEKWGIKIQEQISVAGRVVPPERIIMRDNICNPGSPADWARDTRNEKVISVPPLQNWLMLYSYRNAEAAENILQCLVKVGSGMGFHIEVPRMVQVEDNPFSFLRALQKHVNPDLQMVFCVIPTNQKDSYDCIKKYLVVDQPIPSQCVQGRTLSKQHMMMSVANKIAMQMICKLGGELWAVEIPTWQQCNNDLPIRIVVYRDGVGDGQLRMVLEYELTQLLSSFREIRSSYSPKLSLIVVKKKCTTRFYKQGDRGFQNPVLGTIIDCEATRPEWYDFYLISQNARQGTVNPTYYNVLYDDNCLKPDHMQRLTYKMCHLYYNWPGVIRVPAPCQYASKLNFLVGQSVHREPNVQLSNKLFYL